jgi:Fe-S-cluster containining protein
MMLPLSRAYATRYGVPVVDRVDPSIFTLTYYAECMSCDFCHDSCCQYGADIEVDRVTALERYQVELEAYLGIPRSEWFREDPADVGYIAEAEYPGGRYTRTNIVPLPEGRSAHNEEACVFLDPAGRGCRIHRFALERNIDVHSIKPMVCMLFPLSFAEGLLKPAYEFEVDELICQGAGPNLYSAARSDVKYYFGDELVAELDQLQAQYRGHEHSRLLSLPMS